MNIANFAFFDQSSTQSVSNSFGNINQGSAMTLQVDNLGSETEDFTLFVEGAADMTLPNNYFPLKVISLETFKTVKSITKAGLYMCVIDGIGLVRIKSDSISGLGTFKAYAVSIS